jgi:uncharacterized protein (TIGR02271 family)
MTTSDFTSVQEWRGRTVVDRDGDKIGKLEEIYLDQETGRPEWALVNTGMFGTRSTFVPLSGADPVGNEVQVQWEKGHVKDAPSVEADGQLSHEEEAQLYEHYGFDYSDLEVDSAADGPSGRATSGPGGNDTDYATGRDTSGPTTDDAMTRSEEELQVGKTEQERERVRLKKYVVTEQEQHTIPVQREVARVEREPITDANVDQALDGPEISAEEHEMTLSEERPVVEKQVVPKERVRLGKDVETDQQQVSEDVRKERIEAEGDLER